MLHLKTVFIVLQLPVFALQMCHRLFIRNIIIKKNTVVKTLDNFFFPSGSRIGLLYYYVHVCFGHSATTQRHHTGPVFNDRLFLLEYCSKKIAIYESTAVRSLNLNSLLSKFIIRPLTAYLFQWIFSPRTTQSLHRYMRPVYKQ